MGDGATRLLISESFVSDPDGGINFGTLIFAPYAFLFENSNIRKLPFITKARAMDIETWKKLFGKIESLSTTDNGDFEIKLKYDSGVKCLVRFSKQDSYFPVKIERFSKEGNLALEVCCN